MEITSKLLGPEPGWPLPAKNQVRMRKRILLRFRPFGVAAVLLGCWVARAQNGVVTHQGPAATPGRFVDVTAASGVHFKGQAYHTAKKYLMETMGSGVALFDYDNDGRLDIFFANGAPLSDPTAPGTIPQKAGPKDWNRLYHQKDDGTFEDVTEKAGLAGAGYDMGVAVGDYDNDGYEDLYVTGYGGNRLYHNNGNGTFADVTEASGTGGSGWSTSAAWVDLDNDGRLDLVVLRYLKWDFSDLYCGEHREGYRSYCHPDLFPPIVPLVYHNDGNGHFTEVAAKIGLDKPGKGLGISIADYDRDGHTDIFVANDSMQEFLYHNKGNGTFEEVGLPAGVAVDGEGRTYAGMGIDFSDYNNDGLPDLIITDLANQRYAIYQNNGDGTFTYSSYLNGVAAATLLHSGWGVNFLDYDNDGWKDLIIAQGHDIDNVQLSFPQLRYKEPMLLMHNDGKHLVDVSSASGEIFQQAWAGRGTGSGRYLERWACGCSGDHQRRSCLHRAQRNADQQPLAGDQTCGAQEQPRWHWRGDQTDHFEGNAICYRVHGRQLSVSERQAGTLRVGERCGGAIDRNPLAKWDSANAQEYFRRPRAGGG